MLKKNMSIWGVVSIGIGSMLGAGIFALLGQVVLLTGDRVYLTFGFAGLVAILSGYSYAKLAEFYPNSGGITDYFNQAFQNRFWAGLFSLIYLATLCISIAMLGRSFGIYATNLFGWDNWISGVFAVIVITSLGFFNMKAATNVGKAEIILVALKLSVLAALICISFYLYFLVEKPPLIDHSILAVGFWKGVSFAFFAYAGFGVMTNAAGDVNNPKRIIPMAIFIAILTVAVLYMSLAFVVMKYVPMADLHKNVDTAIAVASRSLFGRYGFTIISLAALVALLSGINALFFSSYKIMDYMSRQKELPSFLNKNLFTGGTIGMFLIIICMSFASFYFDFGLIATVASSAFLISYIAIFIAHLKLIKKTKASLFLILLGLVCMSVIFIQSLLS